MYAVPANELRVRSFYLTPRQESSSFRLECSHMPPDEMGETAIVKIGFVSWSRARRY